MVCVCMSGFRGREVEYDDGDRVIGRTAGIKSYPGEGLAFILEQAIHGQLSRRKSEIGGERTRKGRLVGVLTGERWGRCRDQREEGRFKVDGSSQPSAFLGEAK